jgi:hypothetical protein
MRRTRFLQASKVFDSNRYSWPSEVSVLYFCVHFVDQRALPEIILAHLLFCIFLTVSKPVYIKQTLNFDLWSLKVKLQFYFMYFVPILNIIVHFVFFLLKISSIFIFVNTKTREGLCKFSVSLPQGLQGIQNL